MVIIMKRQWAAIVLGCILMQSVSCTFSKPQKKDDSTTSASATDSAENTASDAMTDHLPEMDFDGDAFNMLVRTERLYYLDVEEQSGDTLDDAVYERNRAVEERFHVKLQFTDILSDKTLFSKAVESSVMADDKGYDLIMPDYWWGLESKGWFVDLNSVDYLDLSRPWWNRSWNENSEIAGKIYTCVGYYTLDLLRNVVVVYFNKDMIQSFHLENPYALVDDNMWTLEKMIEMGKNVAGDANGNGVIDENDRFGLYLNTFSKRSLYYSAGYDPITKQADGSFRIAEPDNRLIYMNDTMYNLMNNSDFVLYREDITVDFTTTLAYQPFNQNHLLFTGFALTAVEAMRQSDVNFGIIPTPKLDADQEWISFNYGLTTMGIPINTADVDRSCIILEALNAESYKTVTPAYYDNVLNSKLARDNESSDMLDMIFQNIRFTFAMINNAAFQSAAVQLADAGTPNVMSFYKSKRTMLEKQLEKLIAAYELLD